MRKHIAIIILTMCLSGCGKSDAQMDVYNSMSQSWNNGYTEHIIVCLNDEYNEINRDDYTEIAEDIIQRYEDNSFKSTLFSFDDKSYPYSLDVSVKRNKEDDSDIFSFSYHIKDTGNESYDCDMVNDKEMYVIAFDNEIDY